MEAMNLTPAQYRVIYNNKNITTDVSDYCLSIGYTDKHAGESDEIELEFHDKDQLWQNAWWPTKGAQISVQIIAEGMILDCGLFTIDEKEFRTDRSAADVFTIRGLAAVITKKLRTKNSTAHEKKTLRELCNTVAAQHGLTVVGTIADLRISRITQDKETDLAFLYRISEKYGYAFSVRGRQLVFTSVLELYKKKHVLSLDKTDLISFSFKSSSKKSASNATNTFHNPEKQATVSKTVTRDEVKSELGYDTREASDDNEEGDEDEVPADDINSDESADDDLQAEAIAKSKMVKAVVQEESIEGSCAGNALVITGNQVEFTGCGRFSGIYYIIESNHVLDKAGAWKTNFKANKTGKVDSKKHKPKDKDSFGAEGPDYNDDDVAPEE